MTSQQRATFLQALWEGATLAIAADAASLSIGTLYRLRAADRAFCAEWIAARESRQSEEARRRLHQVRVERTRDTSTARLRRHIQSLASEVAALECANTDLIVALDKANAQIQQLQQQVQEHTHA